MKLILNMRKGFFVVMGLGLTLLITGCVQSMKVDVDIDELLSNPGSYQKKEVCTQGIYASGFEVSALGATTYQEGDAVYLTEPAIWIEGGEIRSSTDCHDSTTAPAIEFCKVTVCGLFEFGGQYGHLGGYAHQLRAGDR